MTNFAQEERLKTDFVENEMSTETEMEETLHLPDIAVDTHFDLKLEGWPASVALITFALCLSGVMVYGINEWSKVRSTQAFSVTN